MNFAHQLSQLDSLLCTSRWLWKPQPFKELDHISWRTKAPILADQLLRLDEQKLGELISNQSNLINFLQPFIPEIREINSLTELPTASTQTLAPMSNHLRWAIPGRKWEQIEAFINAITPVHGSVIEWCGGKGHLGRLISAQWSCSVTTYEWNKQLCVQGEKLAIRARVNQNFECRNVLEATTSTIKNSPRFVALHACGDLHRHLVELVASNSNYALDLTPCCFHLPTNKDYTALSTGTDLRLDNDDLRLAVTESITSSARERRLQQKEMAWKLGFRRLATIGGSLADYVPIKPIDKSWLSSDFKNFCLKLAHREKFELPANFDSSSFEAQGWNDLKLVNRLSLVRFAFRRAIEVWLVLDIANFLHAREFDVSIGTFCTSSLSPRNILVSARPRCKTS